MDTQDATEATRTRPRSAASRPLQAGDELGRFSIIAELGSGGMGRIYEAYDPFLDRRIALKLVQDSGDDELRQRLVREAQALARLEHPNVVTVHEVGMHEGSLFVAMELLRGGTLKQWIAEHPVGGDDRCQAALSLLIDAGEGLMAAHAAGLVHRDVKPSNILIGDDGRAKIADFGIARTSTNRRTDPLLQTGTGAPSRTSDDCWTDLTRTGAFIGTPSYMAPEQHGKGPVEASADLFAFCTTAWETLLGSRPFRTSTTNERLSDIQRGRVRKPARVQIAAGTEDTLRRGLSFQPSARPATMGVVVSALRLSLPSTKASVEVKKPRRAWTVLVAGASAVTLASVALFVSRTSPDARVCNDTASRILDDWTVPRRTAVRTRIAAGGAPYAERTAATAARMLDDYVTKWGTASNNVCRARLFDENSDSLELQTRCLDSRRSAFSETVDFLSRAEVDVGPQAVQTVVGLPTIESCSDPSVLKHFSRPLSDEADAALKSALAQLTRARAYGGLGEYDRAIGLARDALEIARTFESPSVEAASLLLVGQFQERKGLSREAESSVRASMRAAELASDHTARALALIQLVYIVGRDATRYDDARALAADARTVLRMAGAPRILQADLDMHLGGAARVRRELDTALEHYESALNTYAEVYGPTHPQTGNALTSLGGLFITRNEPERAIETLQHAKQAFESSLGTRHPNIAVVLNNLGTAYKAGGRHDLAIATLEEALRLREEVDGLEHPGVAKTLFNLGSAQLEARRYEDAIVSLRRGRAIIENTSSPEPARAARYDLLVGTAQLNLGRFDDAAATLQPLLDVFPIERGEAGRFARRTRLYLSIALLPTDVARSMTLVELAGDTIGPNDAEHLLFEHVSWLLETVQHQSSTSSGAYSTTQ